jgi:hypothetical protein
VSRFLAINIEGKIGQLTVRRTSSFMKKLQHIKNLLTGSLKYRSIDNLETQKKSISMKNSQFFDYLLCKIEINFE